MLLVVHWVMNWWLNLQRGDRGTWVGGVATFLTLAVTLIITAVNWIRQRSREIELRKAEQDTARRSHAEKLSCWVAGRIRTFDPEFQVHPSELVVTLINASVQPFTKAVVEVGLKAAQETPSVEERRFKIGAVPPGTSWFAFDSEGKQPETFLLSIGFFDNGMRVWHRSSDGALAEVTQDEHSKRYKDAAGVRLHSFDPGKMGLDDA